MMYKILVPVDFSVASYKAANYVNNMATRMPCLIILYHHLMPVNNPFIDSEEIREAYNNKARTGATRKLDTLQHKMSANNSTANIQCVINELPLINGILDFAKHLQIDLIVMGTQGASGLRKIIIGSNAASIIKSSPIPVLMIPEKFKWREPAKMLFSTDLSGSDHPLLATLSNLAQQIRLRVETVHVCAEPEKIKKVKLRSDFFVHTFQQQHPEVNMAFQLLTGESLIKELTSLCKNLNYDILVMVRRKHGFFKRFFAQSLISNLSYITHMPMLIIPAR